MKRMCFWMFTVIFVMVIFAGREGLAADVGIKGGLSLAKLKFSEPGGYDDWQQSTGIQLGAFCSFKLFNGVFLQPELFYVVKGAALSGTYGGEKITSTARLKYIEMPLLIKLAFSTRGSFKPAVFLGGYGAVKIDAGNIIEYAGETVKEDISEEIADQDFGLVLGGAVEWKMGAGKWILDIRYSFGLKSIKENIIEFYTVKNRVLAVMLGYSFSRLF